MWKSVHLFSFIHQLYNKDLLSMYMVLMVKNPPAVTGDIGNMGLIPELGRFLGEGNDNQNPVFLPGKFHGQRNLVGYIVHELQRVRND